MPLTLEVPAEYGYTLTVAASSFLLNLLHVWKASQTRKAAGIPYPNAYATAEQAEKDPKAFAFNCAQRAHANYVENVTQFVSTLLIAGLAYPRASAALGGAWVLGRFMYAVGYTSRGPKGRAKGYIVGVISQLALTGLAIASAVKFLPPFEW